MRAVSKIGTSFPDDLLNTSVNVHCSTPKICITLLSAFFDLILRSPNQQRRENVGTDSIYDL